MHNIFNSENQGKFSLKYRGKNKINNIFTCYSKSSSNALVLAGKEGEIKLICTIEDWVFDALYEIFIDENFDKVLFKKLNMNSFFSKNKYIYENTPTSSY